MTVGPFGGEAGLRLGNMNYKADLPERVRSYLLWRQWIAKSQMEGTDKMAAEKT